MHLFYIQDAIAVKLKLQTMYRFRRDGVSVIAVMVDSYEQELKDLIAAINAKLIELPNK